MEMGLIKKKMFGASASGSSYAEPTLEKIVSDAAAENEFALYKLVNYRRGGSILESYAAQASVGGVKAVDNICEEQLGQFMYAGGAGGTILGSECLAWRRQKRGEVSVTIPRTKVKSPKNEANDQLPCNVPSDHPGCWLLDKRGVLGENPLHILVICDTPTHTKVAKILLRHYPKLALDVMECREYYGLSPLHLAVAYNNMELVQALVEAGANVNERATGRFFMPSDQKEKLTKKTNYSGFTYLGEYPLSWAACCENEAVYNYLLDRGADPNLQDTFGNMILHMVVISNKLGMYGYALRHPRKPANNELLNRAGLTPLTLACTLGRNNIFCEMLELSSQEFWRFSNITCSAYPLIALDSIGPDGRTNWKSALMIILNGESDEHLDMLEGGVVLRLLDDKWKTFARVNQFLIRLSFLFLHLLVLSIAVYLRPKFGESLGWNEDPKSIIRYCAELVTIISCGIFVFVQQGSEVRSQGIFQFMTNLIRSPAKFCFLISNIAILICVPFRIFQMRLVEDSILTFALPGTWFFLMFFAGSVRLTGAFVTMIYSMIAGDMVRFGIIYIIALIGFSQAFFFLFKSCRVGIQEADETNIDMYETYYGTWMALFQMTLGRYQYGDFSKPKYSGLSMGFFVVFMVLVPILLLNVLIAMMSSTYSNVISKSEKEFVKQWAKIVLAVERSVPADKAKEHLNTYAINLAPPPGFDNDSGMQFKGLMVIKSKSKTKAQQRKGALLNWRRMGKRLVGEMRKYSCRGNELLKMMKDEKAKKAPRRGSLTQLLGSVDQDYETSNAAPKGGLGEALSQLAFAHDIDIAGVTTNAPLSPSTANNKFDINLTPTSENNNGNVKNFSEPLKVDLQTPNTLKETALKNKELEKSNTEFKSDDTKLVPKCLQEAVAPAVENLSSVEISKISEPVVNELTENSAQNISIIENSMSTNVIQTSLNEVRESKANLIAVETMTTIANTQTILKNEDFLEKSNERKLEEQQTLSKIIEKPSVEDIQIKTSEQNLKASSPESQLRKEHQLNVISLSDPQLPHLNNKQTLKEIPPKTEAVNHDINSANDLIEKPKPANILPTLNDQQSSSTNETELQHNVLAAIENVVDIQKPVEKINEAITSKETLTQNMVPQAIDSHKTTKKILKQPSFEIHSIKGNSPEKVKFSELPVTIEDPHSTETQIFEDSIKEIAEPPISNQPLNERPFQNEMHKISSAAKTENQESGPKPAQSFLSNEAASAGQRPNTAPSFNDDASCSRAAKKPKRRVVLVSTPSRKTRRVGFTSRIKKLAAKVEPTSDDFSEMVSTVEKEYQKLEAPSKPHTAAAIGLARGLNRWSTKPVVSLECLMDWHDQELDQDSP